MINSASINRLYDNKQFENLMFNLSFRWADEAGYEDIKDYAKPIQNKIAEISSELKFDSFKMTKRPFGFKAIVDYTYVNGETRKSELAFVASVNGGYSWKVKLAK